MCRTKREQAMGCFRLGKPAHGHQLNNFVRERDWKRAKTKPAEKVADGEEEERSL